MASLHEVTCVKKTDRYNAHERIRAIGGQNPDGTNWKLPLEDAIRGIENDRWRFYVRAHGQFVNVVIAVSRWGNKYLKTEADGEQPNNLLSLYECVH
jgi:hypothetical protein